MKKSLILLLALIFLTPSLAFSNIFTFKAGLFIPRAQRGLWEVEFENMSFSKTDYMTTNFGFAYEYFLTREASLVIGVDSYTKNKVGRYVDFAGIQLVEGDFAFPIEDYEEHFPPTHSFNVSITPIQLSLKLTPMGRTGKFIPYVGGGVGLYLWNVRLNGDLVDFDPDNVWVYVPDDIYIYSITFVDQWERNRISFGYHAFGGIMVPFTQRMTFEVEFKYNRAQGELKEAFEGFEPFDLSAYQISLGMNYWF
jgi:opacity protein-like surface antigen